MKPEIATMFRRTPKVIVRGQDNGCTGIAAPSRASRSRGGGGLRHGVSIHVMKAARHRSAVRVDGARRMVFSIYPDVLAETLWVAGTWLFVSRDADNQILSIKEVPVGTEASYVLVDSSADVRARLGDHCHAAMRLTVPVTLETAADMLRLTMEEVQQPLPAVYSDIVEWDSIDQVLYLSLPGHALKKK